MRMQWRPNAATSLTVSHCNHITACDPYIRLLAKLGCVSIWLRIRGDHYNTILTLQHCWKLHNCGLGQVAYKALTLHASGQGTHRRRCSSRCLCLDDAWQCGRWLVELHLFPPPEPPDNPQFYLKACWPVPW